MKDQPMEQVEFEQAIKDYVVKQIDKNNPQIVEYEFKTRIQYRTINLQQPDTPPRRPRVVEGRQLGNRVITPYGQFSNVIEAAAAIGIKPAAVYHRIRTREDYKYAE